MVEECVRLETGKAPINLESVLSVWATRKDAKASVSHPEVILPNSGFSKEDMLYSGEKAMTTGILYSESPDQ